MRPRIGITAYWTEAAWSYWQLPATLVPQGYVEGVRLAGGLPLVLPPTPDGADAPDELLDTLDGLILTGGPDLPVALYGAGAHPETRPGEALRDSFEAALARAARRRRLPTLGICRGMQLLNVVYGGDLQQHLADVVDPEPHRPGPGRFGRHAVAVEPGTALHAMLGGEAEVESAHHQGVGVVGRGLRVTATAPDGTVEGLEDPESAFCVGVLWHPEEQADTGGAPLFRGLVEAARTYAGARGGQAAG